VRLDEVPIPIKDEVHAIDLLVRHNLIRVAIVGEEALVDVVTTDDLAHFLADLGHCLGQLGHYITSSERNDPRAQRMHEVNDSDRERERSVNKNSLLSQRGSFFYLTGKCCSRFTCFIVLTEPISTSITTKYDVLEPV
jgi:hypothetical protein